MKYTLQIHLGETDEGRMPSPIFDEWADHYTKAGDPLEVEADSVEEALEFAFRLGNIGVVEADTQEQASRYFDWLQSYRERDRSRSLSVGDAVVVNGEMGYTVASMGFRPMNEAERAAMVRSAQPA